MHIYDAEEQPDVEVLLDDGTWAQGEATARTSDPRRYRVRWRRGPGLGNHLDWFDASRVRLDTVDRSRGRQA